MNAVDLRGVIPLHLALSRLRVIGGSESEDSPEGIPLTRKKEITQVVVCSIYCFSPAYKVLVCEHLIYEGGVPGVPCNSCYHGPAPLWLLLLAI